MWRGRLSPLKAARLALNLPDGCTFHQALGLDSAWSTEAHLLALVFDALQTANWQRSGSKSARPEPLRRPADIQADRERAQIHQTRAERFLARQRIKKEGVTHE